MKHVLAVPVSAVHPPISEGPGIGKVSSEPPSEAAGGQGEGSFFSGTHPATEAKCSQEAQDPDGTAKAWKYFIF